MASVSFLYQDFPREWANGSASRGAANRPYFPLSSALYTFSLEGSETRV